MVISVASLSGRARARDVRAFAGFGFAFTDAGAFVRLIELSRDTLGDAGFFGERRVVSCCRHEARLRGAFGGHGLVRLLFGLRGRCRTIRVTLAAATT